jgi:hypothetical protein
MPNFPIEHSARVNAFLEKAAAQRPRGRLIFALDATHSRQPTWDTAARLQAEMFHEAGRIGQLSVQLVFYRGLDQCSHSAWTHDAQGLARAMSKISCQAGETQIGKILAHVRHEHQREPVAGVVFVGDALEESASALYEAAAGLPPLIMFQEGSDSEVAAAFKELARLTRGAHFTFDADAARHLSELLCAVAMFAIGGIEALRDMRGEGAQKLLQQLK